MSNVLIGIIGVILFIGLALAGATYVGALVLDGTTQRNAAVITNSLAQTAQAVKIYNMKNRAWARNGLDGVDRLITAGALSSRPPNPFITTGYPVVVDVNGSLTNLRPAYTIMYLGATEEARDACIEIEIQNNNLDRTAEATMEQTIPFTSRANVSKGGCARMPGAFGGPNGGTTGDYLAWYSI
jgi:hypothetical protein